MFSVVLIGVIGILSIIFGAMVLLYGDKSASTRWFFVAIASNGLWAVGLALFLMIPPGYLPVATMVAQGYYIMALTIALSMLLLVLTLGWKKYSVGMQLLAVVPWLVLSGVILLYPSYIIDNIAYGDMQYYITMANGYVAYIVCFMAYYLATIAIIILRRSRQDSRLLKMQFTSILYAYVIAGVLGMIFNLFLPAIGNYALIWVGPIGTFFFIPIIYTAIVKQGLFDIRATLSRSIAYTLTLLILVMAYIVSVYLASFIFVGEELNLNPISVALASLLALLFQPIKLFFDHLTNRFFYRGEYNKEQFVREFGRILSYDTDLRLLLKKASEFIANNLKAERVSFYIADMGIMGNVGAHKPNIPEEDIAKITEYYQQYHDFPEVIVTDMVRTDDVKRVLLSHRVQLVLPLFLQNQAIGCLFIGEHKSRGYTTRDVQSLESIANELTIAVQNSLSVEEIRELNETLQRRVDDATRELRITNQQLQRLDEAKNDFISMASHQLRTPLTSIKGYLDMILQGDLGKVSATQRAVLAEAFLSSERMVALINDFLNVSRLQTGKFIVERRESDLVEIVEGQLQMLDVVAKQRAVTLKRKISSNIPKLNIDADKMRQVVLNMIDNAIYYSPADATVTVTLDVKHSNVEFTVVDKGIGVPKEDQSGLFGKFFRATNARKKRPDGTGVGLFLAKKVILAHGGQVIFSSTEGKGSTFGFSLPITESHIALQQTDKTRNEK